MSAADTIIDFCQSCDFLYVCICVFLLSMAGDGNRQQQLSAFVYFCNKARKIPIENIYEILKRDFSR